MNVFLVTTLVMGRNVDDYLTTLLKCDSIDFVKADMPMGVYHVKH